MADVFISYKREERARVARFASKLEELGLSVFFDARLPSGSTFDEEINRELRAAGAVVVCWSQGAVDSRWVRAEAALALEEDKLAPLLLERINLPAPFNLVHSEYLGAWLGDLGDPAWLKLVDRIGLLCGKRDLARRSRAAAAAANGVADTESDATESRSTHDAASAPAADFIALALIGPLYLLARGRWGAILAWLSMLGIASATTLVIVRPYDNALLPLAVIAFFAVNLSFALCAASIMHADPKPFVSQLGPIAATCAIGPFHLAFRRSAAGLGIWLLWFMCSWALFGSMRSLALGDQILAVGAAMAMSNLSLAPLTPWLASPTQGLTANARQNAKQFLGMDASKYVAMTASIVLMAAIAPIYLLATRRIVAFGAWALLVVAPASAMLTRGMELFWSLPSCALSANVAAAVAAPWIIASKEVPERRNAWQIMQGILLALLLGPILYLWRKQPGAALAWFGLVLFNSPILAELSAAGAGFLHGGYREMFMLSLPPALMDLSPIVSASFGLAFFSPWLLRFGSAR